MGPSCRARTRSTKKWSSRRALFKGSNNTHHKTNIPAIESPVKVSPEAEESPKDVLKNVAASPDTNASLCCTPKAKKYRIPDIKTCPPAPRKKRMLTTCSSKKSPVTFCAPQDIEVFFYLALGDAPTDR